MEWRGLFVTIIMATLLLVLSSLYPQVPVRIRRSGTTETTTHPRLLLDKTKALPASPAVPQDAQNRQYAMGVRNVLRGKRSGNESRRHFAHAHRDLEREFERRHSVLQQGCKQHRARITLPYLKWRSIFKTVFPGPLALCIIKKVASSTLLSVVKQVKDQIPTTPRSLEAVVVRHPLARLTSAYRDKFLNGNPLYMYNDEWRNTTQSSEAWHTRFVLYWLPALVSERSLAQTREFNETLSKIRNAYRMYINHYVGQTGALLAYASEMDEELYGAKIIEVAYNMILTGPHIALVKAFMNSYNLTDVMKRFMNASFTFNQFLHHVVWTHDQGMADMHWMTYTESCDPCRRKFDYILKLETIQEEVNHLFHGVLGYPKMVSFPVRHRSYGHSLDNSDRQYYTNVSRELMERVLDIYKHDFTLFGYKYNL